MSFNFINDKHKKVHFIGIGGISMSGLAEILLKNGFKVSGSDMKSSHITEKLSSLGAEIYIGHKPENLKDANIIVCTAAISNDNPELLKAKELGLSIFDRAEFLGEIMKGHKYNIAVSGTHGKTTTTSMLSHIVLEENLDPTILVGGELDVINGNVLVGNSDYFITEACEYKASFLKFYPYIGIILNIDTDHLDFYRDLNHIKSTFAQFIDIIPADGFLVGNADDENFIDILKETKCNVITFGINNGDLQAKNIYFNENAFPTFDLFKHGQKLFNVSLSVSGEHNILNALASIATALSLNISKDSIIKGLAKFKGTHRRFELKGIKDDITVIDDYAHHPTEIKATIKTALNYPHRNIYFVFQPHTYSRTSTLFKEFVQCFSGVDNLILADIYAAREKDTGSISSLMLGDKIKETGVNCINLHSFEEITNYLKTNCNANDLILTIGAGDIYKVGEMFLKN